MVQYVRTWFLSATMRTSRPTGIELSYTNLQALGE